MKPKSTDQQHFQVEALEPRLLLSADGLAAGVGNSPVEEDPFSDDLAPAIEEEWMAEESLQQVEDHSSDPSDDLFAGAEVLDDLVESDAEEVAADSQVAEDTVAESTETLLEHDEEEGDVSEAATSQAIMVSIDPITGEITITHPISEAVANQVDGDIVAETLVTTLTAANAPPVGGNHIHLDGTNVQVTDDELVLRPGDRLSGTGIIYVPVVVAGGTIAPGNSPGVVTLENEVTFTTDAATIIDIANNGGPGVGHDQIVVSGDLTLGGTLDIDLLGGFTPAVNDLYTIMTWGGTLTGEFENYLGTAIPGTSLAFEPEVDEINQELRLRVVDTEAVAVEVERALRDIADVVDNLLNIQAGQTGIPVIDQSLDDLIAAKDAVTDSIKTELENFIDGLTTQAEVTAEIEGLHGQSFGNFTVEIASVLGNYSTPLDPPGTEYGWDIKMILRETSLTDLLANGLNKAFDFAFGPNSEVTLENTVELDFSIGRASTLDAFLDIRDATVRSKATASVADFLNLLPPWLMGGPVQVGASSTVIFEASLSATPDPGLIPGGRIFSLAAPALPPMGDFDITEAGSLDATFVLDLTIDDPTDMWLPITVLDYQGTHTLKLVDDDIFDMVDADMTLIVDGSLTVLEQQLDGVFTFFKAGTSTDIAIDAEISNLDLVVTAGVGPEFQILQATGTGNFLLEDDGDIAGIATLSIPMGFSPDIPNIDEFSGDFTLTFNTAMDSIDVPLDDMMTETVPAGPYYKIEGFATIGLAIPDVTLSGNFVFEPQDPDNTPNSGDEIVSMGFADLAFDFTDPFGDPLVTVSGANGAFIFTQIGTEKGMFGQFDDADITVNIPGLGGNDDNSDNFLDGVFGGAINDFTSAQTETVDVNGTPVNINVPAGKYLRITGTGVSLNLDPGGLTGLPMEMSGNFTFEQHTEMTTNDKVVTVGFSNVTLPFLDSGDNPIITLSQLTGVFISTKDGIAGEITVPPAGFNVNVGILGLTPTGSSQIGFQIKTMEDPINISTEVAGQTITANLGESKFVKFIATEMDMQVASLDLIHGDFAFEQRESEGGRTVTTIVADNIAFDFGDTVGDIIELSDGKGLFIIDDGQFAGAAQIFLDVKPSIPFVTINNNMPIELNFNFNNDAANAVDEIFDWEGTPTPVDLPAGEYFEVGGPLDIELDVGIGTQTLSGIFTFSQVSDVMGNPQFIGVEFEDLQLELMAGATQVVAFHNGVGQFAFFSDGVAGMSSDLEFDVGLVSMAGSIDLVLNTTGHAVTTSLGGFNINIDEGSNNFLHICVDGHVVVGPGSLAFAFTVESDFSTGDVLFKEKPPASLASPPDYLVKVDSAGTIDIHPDLLALLPTFDKANEHGMFNMIKQVILFLELFRDNSSIFDTEIPFTGGTLGDAFDFAQFFINDIYSQLATVELLSGAMFVDNNGDPLAAGDLPGGGTLPAFSFEVTVGSGSPVTVNYGGGPYTDADDLAAQFNTAFSAAGLATQVQARVHQPGEIKEDRFTIALTQSEVVKHSLLSVSFTEASPDDDPHPMEDLGFADGQTGTETSLYEVPEFVNQLSIALGLGPTTYDPNTQVITFPGVNLSLTSLSPSIDFNFGTELGPLAGADFSATLATNVDLGMSFTLGFDLSAQDVPHAISSSAVPVPSNGVLTDDAHFILEIDETERHQFTLYATDPGGDPGNGVYTDDNTSVGDLADDLNMLFDAAGLKERIIARAAGAGLAISALHEDLDGDGKLDTTNEDLDGNGRLDVEPAGEDLDFDGTVNEQEDSDGDGNLDVDENALGNGDGNLDSQLNVITQLKIIVEQDDIFATEVGYAFEAFRSTGDLFETAGNDYYRTTSRSPVRGLFFEDLSVDGSLSIETPGGIDGSVRLGFAEISTVPAGSFFQTGDFDTVSDIEVSVPFLDDGNMDSRFYVTELTNNIGNIENVVGDVTLTGGLAASLEVTTSLVPLGSDPRVLISMPDINDPTNITVDLQGLNGLANFEKVGFFDIINALSTVADTLGQLESFSFLQEELPVVNTSIADMLAWASKVGDLVDAVSESEADDIEEMLDEFEVQVEALFNLAPDTFDMSVDDNADPVPNASGNASWNPSGDNNGIDFDSNDSNLSDATILITGSHNASGGNAVATWDAGEEILKVEIDPGATDANAIISAVNGIGSPWTASSNEGDGTGLVSKTAIKFAFDFSVGYGNTLPLQFDLQDLVSRIAGDNSAATAFLQQATQFIHVSGDGMLDVAAQASLFLEFGLDLTDPCSIHPFLYDTTRAEISAEVLGTDLEFEASLGSVVGIFVKDGTVTLDADGDPETEGAAFVSFGLKDNNGDGRHYLSEPIFNSDNIGFEARAGLTADLPIYAPTEGTPLGDDTDEDGNGFPDNHLVLDVPDILRLFIPDTATDMMAEIEMRGDENDFIITGPTDNFEVEFRQDAGVGSSATAMPSGNKLIITINSGVTDANAVVSAVNGATGYSATLDNDDDGDDGNAVNDGTGKVAKTTVATPDFSSLFDNLDLCAILDSHASQLLDGLDSLLGTIQDGLDDAAASLSLPLIGNGLAGQARFIEQFREGMLADLREAVDDSGGSASGAVETLIKEALWNSLGPGGLDILVNPDGTELDDGQGPGQLDVTLDCDDGLIVNLRLNWGLDIISAELDFDIGVPGFGLEVDGGVELALSFDFQLGFGLNKEDGFYLDTSADREIFLGFEASIPGLKTTGELFFLVLEVEDDPDDPSMFEGGIHIDIMDPGGDNNKLSIGELGGASFADVIDFDLAAIADINLKISGGFGEGTNFPKVVADFLLDWSWSLEEGASDPQLKFANVGLDLGSYISDFLGPIVREIHKVTGPIEPIVDVVTAPIPILSDLRGRDFSLLDLMGEMGYIEESTLKFINVVIAVIKIVDKLNTFGDSGNIFIPFGDFDLTASNSGKFDEIQQAADALGDFDPEGFLNDLENSNEASVDASASAGFAGDVSSLDNFQFPLYENPLEIANLFVGQPVGLIEWHMPTFKAEAQFTIEIPIFDALQAIFGGRVGIEINLGFGYDTFGIQKFIESGKVIDIFDGFHVIGVDQNGNPRDELVLSGEIFFGAQLNLGGVAKAGVRAGFGLIVGFDLNDPNQDGKVRISEIVSNARIDPRCIFNIHGEIFIFVEAFLTVDLFFFKIDETWRFGEFTLFEFTITCPEPTLASQSGTTLTINVGTNAADRKEIDTDDSAEHVVVTHLEGDANGETVEVNFIGYTQEFPMEGFSPIEKIVINDAGSGDDILEFRGVLAELEVNGGEGNDQIIVADRGETGDVVGSALLEGGSGNDTITVTGLAPNVTIKGDSGEDTLSAGMSSVTIDGGDGSDTITGTLEDDTLIGGGGSDSIKGFAGPDDIDGGDGNDDIDGGSGNDNIDGGDGADDIDGGLGDDIVDGGDGEDTILGGPGNDLLAGGLGNDSLTGHGGVDLLIGDTYDDSNAATILTKLAQINSVTPPTTLDVQSIGINDDADTGGDDQLVGGGNYDLLFGGEGNDFLFGGNFSNTGETDIIEEDDNDFMDGGPGNDELFGDDAHGKTGDRDTGIAIRSIVWLDENDNGIQDPGEPGAGGVVVKLGQPSASAVPADMIVDSTKTSADGTFKFTGLDPDTYFLIFESGYDSGTGKGLVIGKLDQGDNDFLDNDADAVFNPDYNPATEPNIGVTETFVMNVNQTRTDVAAAVVGNPVLGIADSFVTEGNVGESELVFTVSLSRPIAHQITIDYETVNTGSADDTGDDRDYDPIGTTTLVFEPGRQTHTISVPILTDNTYEGAHEQFLIQLSNLQDPGSLETILDDDVAIGTIIEDDPIPEISIGDYIPPIEDDELPPPLEVTPATFVISLSNPSQEDIKVRHQVVDASAYAANGETHYATLGADFLPVLAVDELVTIPAGETEVEVDITLIDDNVDEYEEHFFVELFAAEKAIISDGHGVGIIPDDDMPVTVVIEPNTPVHPVNDPHRTIVEEGDTADFTVRLLDPTGTFPMASEKEVTVGYATNAGTAVSFLPTGQIFQVLFELPDYVSASDNEADGDPQLVFEPGDLTMPISIQTRDDLALEPEEEFFVNLISAENADIVFNHGIVTIPSNDALVLGNILSPISFSQPFYSVEEGEEAKITLVRSPGTTVDSVAIFHAQGITATPGDGSDVLHDYEETSSVIVQFGPGEYLKTVTIPTFEDVLYEADETVLLTMRSPTGKPADAAPWQATLTILNDDALPEFTIEELTTPVTEGADLEFKVTLSGPAQDAPVVYFDVEDITTTEGAAGDYDINDVTAVFPGFELKVLNPQAGNETWTIPIVTNDDANIEAPESVRVTLRDPIRGTLGDDFTAIGTINDNELDVISGKVFNDKNGNEFFEDFTGVANADYTERGMQGVLVNIDDGQGVNVTVATDINGEFSAMVHHGSVTIEVVESSLVGNFVFPANGLPFLTSFSGFELTTGNDNQVIDFRGGTGLFQVEDIGYQAKTLDLPSPGESDTVGRGGTDDTLFGGPGDDALFAGAGDDHVVGGHWMTATNTYAPINEGGGGLYDADITIFDPTTDANAKPLNGHIFGVDTSGLPLTSTIEGVIWADQDSDNTYDQILIPGGGIMPDTSEGLQDIVVHLFDDKGNRVGVTLTNLYGEYSFDTFDGKYRVQVEIPDEWSEVAPQELDPDTGISYTLFQPGMGDPNTVTLDVRLEFGVAPAATQGVDFVKPIYRVDQGEQDTLAIVSLARANASTEAAVVYTTSDGTAMDGVHYEAVTGVVYFAVGQLTSSFVVPILAAGDIPECDTVSLNLHLRAATGRPINDVTMEIQHVGDGITDNDFIEGGDDWDIILGDSGNIAGHLHPARFLPLSPPAGKPAGVEGLDPYTELEFAGGPYSDAIDAGGSLDYVFGQGDSDFITGNAGLDYIDAGMGDDSLIAELGNDTLIGGHGFDKVMAEADADFTLRQNDPDPFYEGNDSLRLDFENPLLLTRFTLVDIEHARLVGGNANNLFTLTDWTGFAEIEGGLGNDRIIVENDTDMTLADQGGSNAAELIEMALAPVVQGLDLNLGKGSGLVSVSDVTSLATSFPISNNTISIFNSVALYSPALLNAFIFAGNSSLTLGNGSVYSIDSVENATLIGGAGNNKIDAHDYSGNVTMQGKGGDDELIGGPGNDTFLYDATDSGNDTITGNGTATSAVDDPGFDTLDFSAIPATTDVTVDLSSLNTPNVWDGGVSTLTFKKEDIDAVIGGDGDDDLTGNARDNTLSGGPGDDRAAGGAGNETYAFDADEPWGKEIIVEDPLDLVGHDILDFSATTDFPVIVDLNITGVSPGADQVIGNLTLVIEAGGFEEVIGGSMDDEITGNGLDNILRGGPGHDLLEGFGGNDFMDGGPGNDRLDGGPGFDSLAETEDVDFTLTDTNVTKGSDYDALKDIEHATLTGGGLPNIFDLTGWTGNADINGGGHFGDTFIMQANADFTLDDADPGDLTIPGVAITVDHLMPAVTGTINVVNVEDFELTGGPSANTFTGEDLSPLAPSMVARGNFTFDGGAGADVITGTIWNDTLAGGGGDDTIKPLSGDDDVDGGTGTDTIVEERSALGGLEFTLNDTYSHIGSGGGFSELDSLADVEQAQIFGGVGNDEITLTEWTGSSVLVDGAAGANNNFIIEVDGDVTLTNTDVTIDGSTSNLTQSNFNNVVIFGGPGDNVFDASGFSSQGVIFAGFDGDDWFLGTKLDDIYSGGDGDDTYAFNADIDIGMDTILDSDGTDTLDFSMTTTQGVTVDLGNAAFQPLTGGATTADLRLFGTPVENVIGGAAADNLKGNAADNTLTGLGGSDTLSGVAGTNTVVETADADFTASDIALTIGGDTDTLNDIQVLDLTGGPGNNNIDASAFTGTTTLRGEAGIDVLSGGSGNDLLIGGPDSDTLKGALGDDTYQFDVDQALGADTISEAGGTDLLDFSPTQSVGITIDLGDTAAQTVHATNLTLTIDTATSIENVIGGDQNDTITGNGVDNDITGGSGDDIIDGVGGTNTITETRDTNFTLTDVFLNVGTDFDFIQNIQIAVLTGGLSNNTLDASAFSGSVSLFGLAGHDILRGGLGDDVLEGGEGNDDLYGGLGDDDYLFDMSTMLGSDLLIEFNGQGFDELIGPAAGADLLNPFPQGIPMASPVLFLEIQNLYVEASS